MVRKSSGRLFDGRLNRTLTLLLCIAFVVLALAITALPTQPAAGQPGQASHLANPAAARSIADLDEVPALTPTPMPAGDAGIWSGG